MTKTAKNKSKKQDRKDNDNSLPDKEVKAQELFAIDTNIQVPAFKEASEYVPLVDPSYVFDKNTTLAILAGFKHNKRVLIQGYHGTGKSTHIEQIAARLNWPCIRINLDGNISRVDLIGKDAIIVEDGKQVTRFKPGIIPWSMEKPIALVLDEYDAARADVLFILQRLLEVEGKFALIEENRIITAHPAFRIFATANTVGLGDDSGLYQGTQILNQGQLDRWNIVSTLNYLPEAKEVKIIKAKLPKLDNKLIRKMVTLADMTRNGFMASDISTVMSPRTVINWGENYQIFGDLEHAFYLSFLNRCDEAEKSIIAEYYQRCFAIELAHFIKQSA